MKELHLHPKLIGAALVNSECDMRYTVLACWLNTDQHLVALALGQHGDLRKIDLLEPAYTLELGE